MRKVFVSGCYDILHAGHLQFFEEARALGEFLTVCFASDEVLWRHKERRPSIPQEHKRALLEALTCVDEVVMGNGDKHGLDFEPHFLRMRPDVLAVTEDDVYRDDKLKLCQEVGAEYVVLDKTPPRFTPLSSSEILRWVRAPQHAPLRVDFAGGWLDVPKFAKEGAYIVNCAITPYVSLRSWPYERRSGLGGSGAWALLTGKDGVSAELDLGVGWQDPAVIRETGLCVWRSGMRPVLDYKDNGDFLGGRMALLWLGMSHDTPSLVDKKRDFDRIATSSKLAREGVRQRDLSLLSAGVSEYYKVQLGEGMASLPTIGNAVAYKYCGGGHGGYALYLFDAAADRYEAIKKHGRRLRTVEPFCK